MEEKQPFLNQVGTADQAVLHLAQDAPEGALPDLRQLVACRGGRHEATLSPGSEPTTHPELNLNVRDPTHPPERKQGETKRGALEADEHYRVSKGSAQLGKQGPERRPARPRRRTPAPPSQDPSAPPTLGKTDSYRAS